MVERLTVGVLARHLGIRPSAVRFYERQGLITSERLANGYRAYDRDAIDALRFINRAKALGFSLTEVREILALHRGGTESCGCVTKMIEHNLASIDQKTAELSGLRRELRRLSKGPAGAHRRQAICPIIESNQ